MSTTTSSAQAGSAQARATFEAAQYLDAVRSELDDLTEDERDDLLDGLEADLGEAACESDLPLDGRLGPPGAYAAELRRSAGLPGRGERNRRSLLGGRVRAGQARLAAQPWVGAVRRFLPELRPGWWVARGYLAVVAFSVLTGGPDASAAFPVPALNGSELAGLIITAAAVTASVRVGRSAPARWGRAIGAADLAVVVASLVLLANLRSERQIQYVSVDGGESGYLSEMSGAFADVTNIYPFAADGTPLEGVLLFDQYGRPIDAMSLPSEVTPDGMHIERQFPTAPDGSLLTNSYPIEQASIDPFTGRRLSGLGRPSVEVPSAPSTLPDGSESSTGPAGGPTATLGPQPTAAPEPTLAPEAGVPSGAEPTPLDGSVPPGTTVAPDPTISPEG